MTTITFRSVFPIIKNSLLLAALVATPFVLLNLFAGAQQLDPTMGLLDAGIWQLLLLSVLCFLGLSALAWWLLQKAWVSLGLPKIKSMVSQFKTLTTWQQLAFYWASFALLLLAAILSLTAIF